MQARLLLLFLIFYSSLVYSQIAVPEPICPGNSKQFTSNIAGSGFTYQWVVDINDGNGFTPLTNNSIYSGTGSSTLTIQSPSTSLVDYKYQCVCTNAGNISLSKIFILQFANTWTGASGTAWEDVNNWSCGAVPDINTDVLVPQGAAFFPVINTNSACRSITVDSPGTVNVPPGIQLMISGKKSNNILNDNVHIIDSTYLLLISDSVQIAQGMYYFTSVTGFPQFQAGDIIAGMAKGGFLRKIQSVVRNGNQVNMQTSPAMFEEAFMQADFTLEIATNNLEDARTTNSANGFSYTIPNYPIYNGPGGSITLKDGNISLNPNWKFNFKIKNSNITYFELGSKGAALDGGFKLDFVLSQAVTQPEETDLLKSFKRPFVTTVPVFGIPFPVVGVIELNLLLKNSFSIDASMQRSVTFNSSNKFDLGIQYMDDLWTSYADIVSNNTIDLSPTSANINAEVGVALMPELKITFYKRVSAYASFGLRETAKAGIVLPALDWDVEVAAWLQALVGAEANVFGAGLVYEKVWNSDSLLYKTPDTLKKFSGNFQVGAANQNLINPIKVKVIDSKGYAQSNVPVYFTVTGGTGTLSNISQVTDNGGIAEATWKLGNELTTQNVIVTAKKSDGSLLNEAPQIFSANVYVDTAALLVSHGVWKALDGIDEDGDPLADTGYFNNYYPVCDTSDAHYGIKDSLHLTFNANGTGIYSLWGQDWGVDIDPVSCIATPYYDPYHLDLGFSWVFVPGESKLRLTFPFQMFDIPPGTPVDFLILGFTPNSMILTANLDYSVTPDWTYTF